MIKILCVALLVLSCFSVNSQFVSNINLVGVRAYVVKIFTDVFRSLEDQHFSTFKLPDLPQVINSTVLGNHVEGTAVYTNSFLVSIQGIDMLGDGQHLKQLWRSPNATTASVTVEGTMRWINVKMGFDLDIELNGQRGRYTSTMTFPLIHIGLVIENDLFTGEITKTVNSRRTTNPTRMTAFPADNITDIILNVYQINSFDEHVQTWGPEIIQPIAEEVVQKTPFPTICYNCPITAI